MELTYNKKGAGLLKKFDEMRKSQAKINRYGALPKIINHERQKSSRINENLPPILDKNKNQQGEMPNLKFENNPSSLSKEDQNFSPLHFDRKVMIQSKNISLSNLLSQQ